LCLNRYFFKTTVIQKIQDIHENLEPDGLIRPDNQASTPVNILDPGAKIFQGNFRGVKVDQTIGINVDKPSSCSIRMVSFVLLIASESAPE
jgi:hypothetical protein